MKDKIPTLQQKQKSCKTAHKPTHLQHICFCPYAQETAIFRLKAGFISGNKLILTNILPKLKSPNFFMYGN
jgi:hypothetical protein